MRRRHLRTLAGGLAVTLCLSVGGCSQQLPTGPGGGAGGIGTGPVTTWSPTTPAPPSDAELAAGSVSYGRSQCLGTCPSYQVTLHGDGRVEWDGEAYVDTVGKHTARANPAAVRALLKQLRTGDFRTLKARYDDRIDDAPTYVIELRVGASAQRVYVNSSQEPPAFTRAETDIKALAGVDRFVGTGKGGAR